MTPLSAPTYVYPHVARRAVLPYIPSNARRLLDVGCNTGAFGEALKATREIDVWGIEPNPVAADQATKVLDKVICGFFDAQTDVPDGHFDVISFTDVLEHMSEPEKALELTKRKLAPQGVVIATLPNVRHQSNLRHLIFEADFRYEDEGIRDRTHLRFFTKKSGMRLFEEAGFSLDVVAGINEEWDYTLPFRLLYRVFAQSLQDTKYVQHLYVARLK